MASKDDAVTWSQFMDVIQKYDDRFKEYERRITRIETLLMILLAMSGLNILISLFM